MHLSSTDRGHTRDGRSSIRAMPAPASAAPSATSSAMLHDRASSTAVWLDRSKSLASTLLCRRLSPAEMAQRRADGQCYNCDEKFIAAHRCKKLFIIEIVEFDNTEETVEAAAISGTHNTPGISLHAVTGVHAR